MFTNRFFIDIPVKVGGDEIFFVQGGAVYCDDIMYNRYLPNLILYGICEEYAHTVNMVPPSIWGYLYFHNMLLNKLSLIPTANNILIVAFIDPRDPRVRRWQFAIRANND